MAKTRDGRHALSTAPRPAVRPIVNTEMWRFLATLARVHDRKTGGRTTQERDDSRLRVVGVVAQDTEQRGSEREVLPIDDRRIDPSRAQGAPELPV